jgi:hypothetical protein
MKVWIFDLFADAPNIPSSAFLVAEADRESALRVAAASYRNEWDISVFEGEVVAALGDNILFPIGNNESIEGMTFTEEEPRAKYLIYFQDKNGHIKGSWCVHEKSLEEVIAQHETYKHQGTVVVEVTTKGHHITMPNPTLKEFVARDWPHNSYLTHPEFSSIYVRKGAITVFFGEDCFRCDKVITIGSANAKNPGQGAFGRFVEELVKDGYAVYAECVHNERFRDKLLKMGFVKVNDHTGDHFLFNHDGHLTRIK